MDFRLYARVLWRFRVLFALGLLLATALAMLSIVKVSADGTTYRKGQLWSSTRLRLLVTQKGFPEGRLYAQKPSQPGDTSAQMAAEVPVADPAALQHPGDPLCRARHERPGPEVDAPVTPRGQIARGQVIATPLRDDQSGVLLPLIDLIAISDSPRAGSCARGANALNAYIWGAAAREQRARRRSSRGADDRPAAARSLFQPRSKTMSIVVFLAVMFATVGLAFVLENVRPRQPSVGESSDAELRDTEQRRTA